MIMDNELEGFRRDRYFARSWALLTRDRGWVKPVLVLSVALLVPVVGLLGVLGYALEWARLTAWGVNASPKQRGVDVGACIKSGWRAFLVILVWSIVTGIVVGVLSALPLLGGLVSLAWAVCSFLFSVVVMVASLRATIYQRFGAGMRLSTIWQMISHDPVGLLRVACIVLVGGALMGLVTMLVMTAALTGAVSELIWYLEYLSYGSAMSSSAELALAIRLLASLVSSMGPAIVVLVLLDGIMGVTFTLLAHTAVGLWMRQFDVASWGRDEDPLPPFKADPRDAWANQSWQPMPQQGVPGPAKNDEAAEKDTGAEKNLLPELGPVEPAQADSSDQGPVSEGGR